MKIIFIGSGNVATHLALVLKSSGHQILQVYSRKLINAKKLAQKINCASSNDLKKIKTDADIYFICVKDDAVEKIISDLPVRRQGFGFSISDFQIFVHTSGSIIMNILKNKFKNHGVFYPMQTFSKQKKIDLTNTAIFVEANNKFTEKKLIQLAKSITKKVHLMNSEQRKVVHLAAVFVNNFTNYFYIIAEDILKKRNLSFEILKPLIFETSQKIQNLSPMEMQTGPAKRGDKKIIETHLKMLNDFPEYKKIYSLISKSISEKYQNQK